ncbi:MAG: YdcF family protein, partial [Armatimonadota bacterium]|nr:YdcF family protein [Armatimonadota bacterium]
MKFQLQVAAETNPAHVTKPLPPARMVQGIVCLSLLGFGGLIAFLDAYGQHERAQPAEAIVILGAQVNTYGVPGQSLRARTLHAVELYERGLAPKIICTGGIGTFPPSEAKAAATLAMRHGVPAQALLLEEESTSTWENVQNAAHICRAHGWQRVIVVSDPFHLWRARRNFAMLGLTTYPSPSANREAWPRLVNTTREA